MMLNQLQRKIVIAATAIFIVMDLFPPWTYTLKFQSFYHEKPAGYTLILDPPRPEVDSIGYGVRIDLSRLFLQWLILVAAAWGGIMLAKRSGLGSGMSIDFQVDRR